MRILSTQVIAELALILSMFAGISATQYFFLEQSLSHKIDNVEVRLTAKITTLEIRQEALEHRVDRIEHRIDGIERRIDSIDQKLDRLIEHLLNKE